MQVTLPSETLKLIEQYNKLVPLQEEINKLSHEHKRNISDIVDGMGSIVGLSDKYTGSFIGKMTKTFELFGKETDRSRSGYYRFSSQIFNNVLDAKYRDEYWIGDIQSIDGDT